jgi:hypothetical protein
MATELQEYIDMIDGHRYNLKIDFQFSIGTLAEMLSKYDEGVITGEELAYTSRFIVDAMSATMDKI